MLKCDVCGKATGLLAALMRVSHVECATMPILKQIDRGEFRSFDDQAEILLEHDEHCLAFVRGCEMADPDPALAENEAPEATLSSTPGLRPDGLVSQGIGLLHVTDRKICFMGHFNSRTIPLGKIVEVRNQADVLAVVAGDHRLTSYFILESPRRVEITAAAVRKLTELARTNQKPTVHLPPEQFPQFQYASD
ncbi:MAG TPA: hypothetical protein VG204_20060 [Terriglobia bacterium]|nr:hypothetical protein [Terriglobia bacterium]